MAAKKKVEEVVTKVTLAPEPTKSLSIVDKMAERFGMDREAFLRVLNGTVMPKNCKPEQAAAFLMICERYKLDPFASEVYAFPGQGGVKALVGVDGFISIANREPAFDGLSYEHAFAEDGTITAITCTVHRKDRSQPTSATEYMVECRGKSPIWRSMPNRMLRHKATIQAIRLAFGMAGLGDVDEYKEISNKAESAAPDLNNLITSAEGV